MTGTYDPSEPLARLIYQLEKGRGFARSGGQTVSKTMMVSKGIRLLAQIATSYKEICKWI